ncbi:MAG: hypothetical protein JKY08_11055 [Flavobacteriaceae bacterium]|nr:hypothetical protein [Flavobacteriaceae bacterium]
MDLFKKIIFCSLFLISISSYGRVPLFFIWEYNAEVEVEPLDTFFDFLQAKDFEKIEKLIKEGATTEGLTLLLTYIEEEEEGFNTDRLVKAYILMAQLLSDNKDYVQALDYYYKVDKYIQKDSVLLSSNYFKKGAVFQRLSKLDSAKFQYEKALLYATNFPSLEKEKAKINNNLSGVYYLKKDFKKALEIAEIADSIQVGLGDSVLRAGILNSIGAIYYMQGAFESSLFTYKKVLKLAESGHTDLHRNTRSLAYINLAYAYSGLGDFEHAFYHQDMYFSLNDSLQSELKYKEIHEIQAKFALVKKSTEISDAHLQRKKAEFMSYGMGLFVFLILTGAWFLMKFYKLNRKHLKLEFKQQQLLNENKLKKLESLMQIRSINAALDGRLEERKKIASILHDSVSTLLSSANLHLHASKVLLKCEVPVEIEKTQEIITEAAEKIRNLSHTLISSVLLKFGLGYATQDLCEKSSNSQLDITFKEDGIGRYDQTFEIKMHNLINELLNNILKHSQASEASIYMVDQGEKLRVIIKDNGVGFEMDKVVQKDGLGLSQVKSRIVVMGGVFRVESTRENGTKITVIVPVKH